MVVPNYVPDPIEIPGNVTEKPYRVRLAFIRRVQGLHLLTLAFVFFVAIAGPSLPLPVLGISLGAGLVALAFLRVGLRGSVPEWVISGALLLPVLGVTGLTLGELYRQGIPTWAMAAGPIAAYVYSILSGRDFSFMGQWVLSLLFSSLAVAALSNYHALPALQGGEALLLNAAYLSYLVYDSASLLSRRRLGEEVGAVADLYRDVLNVFGYVVRVIRHWRKHRIWAIR